MLVSGLIQQALMVMGDMGPGYTASTDVLNTGFETVNGLLASWSAEGNMIAQLSANAHAMTGASVYTIGVGGNINTARPIKILTAKMSANNISLPVTIVDAEEWAQNRDESATGTYAKKLWCDYIQPQAAIYLWPTPAINSVLTIFSLKPLSAFAALGDPVSLHPGYEHALTYNLAVLLAPKLRRQVPEYVGTIAAQAKAGLARLNEEVLRAWVPAAEVAQ